MSKIPQRILIAIIISTLLAVNVNADRLSRDARRAKKVTELTDAAKQGDAEAQTRLGLLYLRDPAGFEQMLYWLNKAVAQNYPLAQFELAKIYHNFSSKIDSSTPLENQEKTQALLRQSAEGGYHLAQLEVGMKYGRKKDFFSAILWIKKAADQNNVEAMELLSQMIAEGKGSDSKPKEAFQWMKLASEAGSNSATFKLGMYYGMGLGTTKDSVQALDFVKKAALAGDEAAMNYLYKDAQNNNVASQHLLAQVLEKNN